MFARDKRIGPYTYVYLVENVREEGRTKQRIIANLGRKEVVVARGDLDRLARSVVRLAQRSMVLSLVEGEAPPNARCQRIGPALLFERLWHEVGCRAVLARLSQLDPDLGNFADGLNGNWLIGLVRSRKNSGKAAAVPTK